jgi:SAM-dependent methyltransferase
MVEFTCACCDASDGNEIGVYALPPRGQGAHRPVVMSYDLVECRTCGHVAAHPAPSEVDIHQYYASENFWSAHGVDENFANNGWLDNVTGNASLYERFDRARRQLTRVEEAAVFEKSARIIDLGSGYSPFLYHCRQRGYQNLYALEPSADICRFLEGEGITAYDMLLENFIERTDLPKFDVMVISHTIEHLLRPGEILSGLRRLLSDRGALYIDVPFQDHRRPHHQGLHLQFFSENSMHRLLKGCGYRMGKLEVDRHGLIERMILGALYFAYARFFKGGGGISPSPKIERLHRYLWRPFKRLLGARINIFISSADLRTVASPEPNP